LHPGYIFPSLGAPAIGNNSFVFHSELGNDPSHSSPHDAELEHLAGIQSIQQLVSIVSPDLPGNAAIDLTHAP
jgi:hypothetical protein